MIKSTITEAKIRHLELANPLRFASGASLFNVILEMKNKKQSCVLICDGDYCVGIFTERDYLNKVFGQDIHTSARVDEFMSRDPRTLTVNETLGQAIRLMHENGFRNIPLTDQAGKCAGLLRIRDIVDFLAETFPEEVLNVPPRPERFDAPDGA